jgi:isoleucyl-tRNA synthetase
MLGMELGSGSEDHVVLRIEIHESKHPYGYFWRYTTPGGTILHESTGIFVTMDDCARHALAQFRTDRPSE